MFGRDTFTDKERLMMEQLVEMQKYGCTLHVLEALDQRKRVEVGFASAMRDMASQLRIAAGGNIETRIVENWAKPLAVFHCLEVRLRVPFSFAVVLQLALRGITKQSAMSGEGNELAHFWRTIMYLRDNGDLYEKGDYHIKSYQRFSSDIIQNRVFAEPRPILLLNTSRVFMLYKEAARRSGDKIIPDDALREYIKNCDYFLGYLKSVRFISIVNGYEQKEQDASGAMRPVSRVTRAMAFDYEILKEKYGITLEASTSTLSPTDDERMEEAPSPAPQEPQLPF